VQFEKRPSEDNYFLFGDLDAIANAKSPQNTLVFE